MGSTWTDFDTAAVSSLFFLGHEPEHEEKPIGYPLAPDDRPHLGYYGTTRSGKSYAIEYALQQLARSRAAGFCFIDPHGTSYWRMASFLRENNITERVLFWDINDPDYIVTFDPFAHPTQSTSYIAGNLTTALLATLGRQADANEQPHLKTMIEDGLEALLKLKLAFPLVRQLFDPSETEVKEAVARLLPSSNLVASVAAMPRFQDRREELAAPYRRIVNLFRDDRLKLSFSTAGVNFREFMDEGWIVLVNTEQRDQADEAATLYTRMLVKQFFMAAKGRTQKDPPSFFLAIDEASRYLTTDTAQILSQTGKFGLHLLVGMQSIDQAQLENEESYIAIRKNMNAEVVMRLSDYEEAIHFARRFYGGSFNFKTIKWQEWRTVVIPHSVPHVLTGYADAEGDHESTGPTGSAAQGTTRTHTTVTSPGFHTEYEEREELTPPIYSSPDELEREAAKLFLNRPPGMGQRFGVARVNEGTTKQIEIPELPPPLYVREEMVAYVQEFKRTQPATLMRHEAEERYRLLEQEHLARLNAPVDAPPTSPKKKLPRTGQAWDFSLPDSKKSEPATNRSKSAPPKPKR
jgi:hypothetical protein